MPKRDDTVLDSDMPSLIPEKDELVDRRGGGDRRATDRRKLPKGAKKKTAADKGAGNSSNGSVIFFFVVLLAMVAGLGYWSYLLQNVVEEQTTQLDQASKRIASLEDRLSTTDESMSKSSVVMQVQLKELKDKTEQLWVQMDKLWASAWRRNQKEIASHTEQLKNNRSDLDAQKKEMLVFRASLDNLESGQAEVKGNMEKFAEATKAVDAMGAEVKNLKQQSDGNASNLASLKKSQTGLEKQVKTNATWVESINANRRQVNAAIEELRESIEQIRNPDKASGAAVPSGLSG